MFKYPVIIFEGIEASGKSTNLNIAAKYLKKKRQTLCISSQAGCALQCTFCATGYHGFKRNLTSAEIISQLWLANYYEDNSERISNVVFMGMGEPLMNTENVLKTIQIY